MQNSSKSWLKYLLVIVAVLIVSSLALTGSTPRKKSLNPLVIGGLFNQTGYGAFAGEASRDGFMLAIEDSGLSTSTVKIVIEDAQSDQKTAVNGATKLTSIDKAVAVVGPEWTEFGQAVSPVVVYAKVPFFSPWVVAEAEFVSKPYFWSMTPSDKSEHAAITQYMAEHNLIKVSIVSSKNFWSDVNTKMFKEEAEKNGLQIISSYQIDQTTSDFRTTIAKIKTDNPDIIYSAIADDTGHAGFLKQLHVLGVKKLVATHSVRAGSQVLKDRVLELMSMQMFAEMEKPIRNAEFEKKYEARFGKKVGAPSAAASYDATLIIINAIKAGAKNSQEIIEYIEKMPSFEGYSGTIAFDSQGKLPLRKATVKSYTPGGELIELK